MELLPLSSAARALDSLHSASAITYSAAPHLLLSTNQGMRSPTFPSMNSWWSMHAARSPSALRSFTRPSATARTTSAQLSYTRLLATLAAPRTKSGGCSSSQSSSLKLARKNGTYGARERRGMVRYLPSQVLNAPSSRSPRFS